MSCGSHEMQARNSFELHNLSILGTVNAPHLNKKGITIYVLSCHVIQLLARC